MPRPEGPKRTAAPLHAVRAATTGGCRGSRERVPFCLANAALEFNALQYDHFSLVRTYGSERVEAASRRGNDIGATTYGSIKSILQNGLDKAYADQKAPDGPPIRHARLLKTLSRVDLLILDDWGLVPVTLDQARDLLEIVDDRHGRGSTIVTTQLPIEHWHEMIPKARCDSLRKWAIIARHAERIIDAGQTSGCSRRTLTFLGSLQLA